MWMASGLYMTAIPIETIRGNHLVEHAVKGSIDSENLFPLSALLETHAPVESVTLRNRNQQAVYVLTQNDSKIFINATTGSLLEPLSEADAKQIAKSAFTGSEDVAQTLLISDFELAPEARGRPLPLWQITFADTFNTTFYVDAKLADIVAVRSDLWRWFDIFWMLHIMDYDERSDFNNPLVILMVTLGLFLTLSGFLMLANAFKHKGIAGVLK
jgi:hypothetical protein